MKVMDDFLEEAMEQPEAVTAAQRAAQARHGDGQLTVDVYEEDGDIVVKSTVAGVSPDEIDIAITKDTVTIKGERQLEDKRKSGGYYHRELFWGGFSRSIILPEDIDPEKAKATMKHGLLTIRLPKLSKIKTKKLKIAS